MPSALDAPTLTGTALSTSSVLAQATPALTILWHPDPSRVGAMFSFADLRQGRTLSLSRNSPEFPLFTDAPAPLADPFLSRQPCLDIAILSRTIRLTPLAHRQPIALDGHPLLAPVALSQTDVAASPIITFGRRIALCLHYAHQPPQSVSDLGLLGHSDAINAVRKSILSVADLDIPVLIRGETGTGKELTAAAIVKVGLRAHKPFVAVNIGALPQQLAAAEIFGHAKGAFTGATGARPGYFLEADGGTLLLDEIGLATSEVQTALLRLLETGEVRPIGARTSTRVNVRILAATDSLIDSTLAAGGFSQPLFHRLSSVQISLPPLRERRQDIGLLFLHFLRETLAKTHDLEKLQTPPEDARPWLSATDLASLAMAPWPGNVRQLRNCAIQLAVSNRGAPLARLPQSFVETMAAEPAQPSSSQPSTPEPSPQRIPHAKLVDALARHDFQPARAARALRVSRTTIYEHIRRDSTLGLLTRLTDDQLATELKNCDGNIRDLAKRLRVSYRALQLRLSKS